MAWFYTQLRRMEDYWMIDLGDRIATLEDLQQSVSGNLPIVDYGALTFGYEIGTSLAACSDAIWPINSGDTNGFHHDLSDNGYNIEIQPGEYGDLPSDESKYLSTDVAVGSGSTHSWDMTYNDPSISNGYGFFGIVKDRQLANFVQTAGYIEFYFKRRAIRYNGTGMSEYLLHCFDSKDGVRYGFRVYLDPTSDQFSSTSKAELKFEVGITDGLIRYDTSVDYITNDVWRKVRIEWRPDELTNSDLAAAKLYVDNVEYLWSVGRRVGTSTTPSDVDNYVPAVSDPNGEKMWMYVGNSNNPVATTAGFNGWMDEIKISHCGFLDS